MHALAQSQTLPDAMSLPAQARNGLGAFSAVGTPTLGSRKVARTRMSVRGGNGPQFISRDFKEFICIAGMTHVKTSPYYPQSNGKIERYHRTIKGDCIRAKSMTSVDDARQAVTQYVHHYNTVRLHSAIGYVTPHTKLAGKEKELFAQRDEKLEAARERRRLRRTEAIQNVA